MRIRVLCAAVGLVLTLSGAVGLVLTMTAAAGAAEALDVKRYMPLSEVEPGMTGVGKTTLSGATIVEFQVKVLAVLRKVGPKRDLIVVRCSGAGLEESGVVAGMSGSPVYIGGRLIGGVAYSFPWSKLPLAGVQPIEQMLRVTDAQPWGEAADGALRISDFGLRIEHGGAGATSFNPKYEIGNPQSVPVSALGLVIPPPALAGRDACDMQPIKAPVLVSGMTARCLDCLREELAPLGLVPMQGGGTDIKLPAASVLEPGAPLAITLARGDAQITTMGTITDIAGDRLYGFGHAMLGLGEADFPLMTGIGQVVVPTLNSSFRLGAPVREVGRLMWDEETAILGRISKDRAPMVPVTVNVKGPGKGRTQSFSYEIAHQRMLLPMLASALTASSLTHQSDLPRDHTITYRVTVRPVGEEPVVRENLVVSPGGDSLLQMQVRTLVSVLMENPFRNTKIESVDVQATIEAVSRAADIEEVRPLRNAVRPGGTVPVEVRIRPWRAEPEWITVEVAVPADYPEGTSRATLCGADEALRQEAREVPVRFRPDSAESLLEFLGRQERRDQLFIRLDVPGEGLAIGRDELPNLPGSMRAVLSDSARREVTSVTAARVTKRAVPYVLQGSRTIDLKIDRKAPEP